MKKIYSFVISIAIILPLAVVLFSQTTQAKIEFPLYFRYGVPGAKVTAGNKSATINAQGEAKICCFEYGGKSRGKKFYYSIEKEGYMGRYNTFQYVTQDPVSIKAQLISICAYSKKNHYSSDNNFVDKLPDDADNDGISAHCDCDDNDRNNKSQKPNCPEVRTCNDTDPGNDPYKKGTVTQSGSIAPKDDWCSAVEPGVLFQQRCNANKDWEQMPRHYCESGQCTNGACVKKTVSTTNNTYQKPPKPAVVQTNTQATTTNQVEPNRTTPQPTPEATPEETFLISDDICNNINTLLGPELAGLCREHIEQEQNNNETAVPEECLFLELMGVSPKECKNFERRSQERDKKCEQFSAMSMAVIANKNRCLSQCTPKLNTNQSCLWCWDVYGKQRDEIIKIAGEKGVPSVCIEKYIPPPASRADLELIIIDSIEATRIDGEGSGQKPQIFRRYQDQYDEVSLDVLTIKSQDVIRSNDHQLSINLANGLSITMDPHAQMSIEELVGVAENKSRQRQFIIRQQQGRIEYERTIDNAAASLITTIDAIIYSPHTKFAVHKGDVTTVKVYEGKVTAYNPSGTSSVEIEQGQISTIKRGENPKKPYAFDEKLHNQITPWFKSTAAIMIGMLGTGLIIGIAITFWLLKKRQINQFE